MIYQVVSARPGQVPGDVDIVGKVEVLVVVNVTTGDGDTHPAGLVRSGVGLHLEADAISEPLGDAVAAIVSKFRPAKFDPSNTGHVESLCTAINRQHSQKPINFEPKPKT
jgi:hypothetical protein